MLRSLHLLSSTDMSHRTPMPVRFQQSSLTAQELEHGDYQMRLTKALTDNGSAILTKLMKLQDEVSVFSA